MHYVTAVRFFAFHLFLEDILYLCGKCEGVNNCDEIIYFCTSYPVSSDITIVILYHTIYLKKQLGYNNYA